MKKALIVGGNIINKGAEAMLRMSVDTFKDRFELFLYPLKEEKTIINERYNINEISFHWTKREIILKCIMNPIIIINKFRKRISISDSCRIYEYKNFDLIIDISGYVYGDKWGVSSLNSLYNITNYCNIKYVIMSQALGPFTNKEFHPIKNKLGSKNNLYVMARDEQSLSNIKKFKKIKKIILSNDTVFGGSIKNDSDKKIDIVFTPSVHIENRLSVNQKSMLFDFLKGINDKYKISIIPTEYRIGNSNDDYKLSEDYSENLNLNYEVLRKDSLYNIEKTFSLLKINDFCR